MPTTTWNTTTINGKEYLVIDTAKFRIPLDWDPSSNMFFAVAAPDGGLGSFPALVKGDKGDAPTISGVILTSMNWDDPTPASATFTSTGPGVYTLNLALHEGEPGADGTATLDPTAFGTPVSKKLLVVNPAANGFIYQTQKVGDRYYPTTINSVPSGNAAYTLCAVGVPAQDFDWRARCFGSVQVTGTGANVSVDLVARLNVEASGNVIARAFDTPGNALILTNFTHPPHVLIPAVTTTDTTAGGANYDKVNTGAPATIFMRTERQSGTDSYTTSGTRTTFSVEVHPIP